MKHVGRLFLDHLVTVAAVTALLVGGWALHLSLRTAADAKSYTRHQAYTACVERNVSRIGNRRLVNGLLVVTHAKPEFVAATHRLLDSTQPIVNCPKP